MNGDEEFKIGDKVVVCYSDAEPTMGIITDIDFENDLVDIQCSECGMVHTGYLMDQIYKETKSDVKETQEKGQTSYIEIN